MVYSVPFLQYNLRGSGATVFIGKVVVNFFVDFKVNPHNLDIGEV